MTEPFRFELRQLTEYTHDSILDEIRRVAALVPENDTLSVERFNRLGRVGANTVRRRFGTWRSALAAAGLSHRSSGHEGVRTPERSKGMEDEAVLEELREAARRIGRSVLTRDDIRVHTLLGQRTLERRWGSLQNAIRAAGLETSSMGNRYSDEECFQNLFAVWSHYGRAPQHREMSEPPSIVGPKAYVGRFGGWRKALAAFVEWVESSSEQTEPVSQTLETLEQRHQVRREPDQRGSRDISWGLRFKVLNRDRFKCVLCGDHPATNPACKLHVDHIQPWSKGGATTIQNLRALCEVCNVGRGNRYYD